MTKNESIWDARRSWNGRERRIATRRRVELDEDIEVIIRSRRANEIAGVIVDVSDTGMGIAVSAKEPIAVDDLVVVENGENSFDGIVRHITEDEVVLVGIEWLGSFTSS